MAEKQKIPEGIRGIVTFRHKNFHVTSESPDDNFILKQNHFPSNAQHIF